MQEIIADLIACGAQVDLEVGMARLREQEKARQEEQERITYGAVTAVGVGVSLLAVRKLGQLHALRKKRIAARDAGRLFKSMLARLAAVHPTVRGSAGALPEPGQLHAPRLQPTMDPTPNDSIDQLGLLRSEQHAQQQGRPTRRTLRMRERQQRQERPAAPEAPVDSPPTAQAPQQPGTALSPQAAYPHLAPKLAIALAEVTATVPPHLVPALERLAEELERAGDFDNAQACVDAIRDAGGTPTGSGGSGHAKLKRLDKVYEISGHSYKHHKKGKSLETKICVLQWWALNLEHGMPPRWRPRQVN